MEEYIVKVHADGSKSWFQKGKYHRIDGPAVENTNGHKAWYQNGKYHRIDGPAIEFANGYKAWYQNGKCHNLNGPAIEFADGHKSWYIEGVEYTEEEFNQKINNYDGKVVTIDGKEYTLKLN